MNYSSSFSVLLNATLLTLGQSLNGISNQASLVLGDLNNDTLVDLVIAGTNGTKILDVYMNNGSAYVFNQSIENYGIKRGSLALIDYDKDSDLDISSTGEDIDGDPSTKIIKNN